VRAPDLDDDRGPRLGDTAGLAKRGYDVVGEEERVEAGDEVERVVLVGQRLHLADPEIGVREALASDVEQRVGGVQAERARVAVRDEAQERPDAAADVEHQLRRLEPDTPQRLRVGRHLLVLAQRPVRGACAPQRPPAFGAARDGGRRHVHSSH
jgi:hypothetical protein